MNVVPPIRVLLRSAIDYAGLFPPAAVSMAEAVDNYATYRGSPDAWALGRFVVPAARLAELAETLGRPVHPGPGLPLAVTLGDDPVKDMTLVGGLAARLNGVGAVTEVIEARTADAEAVARLAAAADGRRWYGEVPLGPARDGVLDALAARGGRAKIRMGGVTADAFPDAERVAAFLVAVTRRQLGFKATAGLHHPVGGTYPLTYDAGAAAGRMYGYLNLAFATALAAGGADVASVEAALRGGSTAPVVKADGLFWDGRHVDTAAVDRMRQFFDGFGSCSFREPLDDLEKMVP